MKTSYLLSIVCIVCLAQFNQLSAQCSFVNPGVELNNVTTNPTTCTVNVNLSFTIDKNNGNKYTYVHLWTPSQYPNIDYKKAPTAADLGAVLATLAIDMDGTAALLPTYSADPSIIPLFTGLTISEQHISGDLYKITINNIQFPVPGACTSLPVLKGDVWSTQSQSNNPPVHCFAKGFNLAIADPKASGLINCNAPAGPRTYDLDITTTSLTAFDITYKLYLDDGVLINGEATFGPGDNLFLTSPTTSISSTLPVDINAANYTYLPAESLRSIWVEVTSPSLPNAIIAELKNNCVTPLPVKLTQFKGDLLDNAISLSWATTEESGSSHFDIQRSGDLQEFMTIGKVMAKGSSTTKLNYNFLDTSPTQGNNYYRLRQVDKDGSFENSRIISVANNTNSVAFEILGNPVVNRELKFLLKGDSQQNIRLFDMSGRTIPFSLINTGNIYTVKPVGNLSSGLYILSLQNQGNIRSKKVLVP
ncbi:T9SS type A sorting domain-containing protein [Dyadobacter sp. LHD-138]|uniref:T9SS type A sorting domain-containing protein n=1 Tax=Dyadobacter sp. LHD-138 TaxID=3071413 RepID=UPI0027E1FF42|nr:T9SS type A sorting domain-containing protein [Dyadobacter sp. LHD-138]MDQ6480253.1 T9SS type A sorting domain-containing protein [Dyadobacter sp. LHD-138]